MRRAGLVMTLAFLLAASSGEARAQLSRGPYLQAGTPTSITVRWRTQLPTNSRVAYGPAPGQLTQLADDPALVTEHIVQVTGLLPGTRYYYSVGSSSQVLAGGQPDYFFVTPQPAGTYQPTRIWVLGDSGTANDDARDVRDAYYAFTGSRHTDLWLMLGDNAYPMGTDAEYQAAVFDIYPEMLRKSVLWPTIGNHDAMSASSANQSGTYYNIFTLPAAGQAGGIPSGTEAYYAFDFANIHFIVLNSQDVDRSPGSPMVSWLQTDLASTDQDWIIAFWHHPPYSSGLHHSDNPSGLDLELVEMRQNVVPVLDAHGVDLTLTGHSHDYERSFLIDGHYGLSSTFDPQTHAVDGGDGREDGDGAYRKDGVGSLAHSGIVHTVAGSSGLITGVGNHPAMYTSQNRLGSLVLDVNANRLDATFIDQTGFLRDHYTIIKDCADGDTDDDDICDVVDNCPGVPNTSQQNLDGDGAGDVCDSCPADPQDDADADGLCANADNCPLVGNPEQVNTDGDLQGDLCDADDDNDGFADVVDCSPLVIGVSSPPGPVGSTLRLDRFGGARLRWTRAWQGHTSNVYRGQITLSHTLTAPVCFSPENPEIEKRDSQNPAPGIAYYYIVTARNMCGDQAPVMQIPAPCAQINDDFDGESVPDTSDNCPLFPNVTQTDTDRDFVGNSCDNCATLSNATQADCDADLVGDACDISSDCDFDGVQNLSDNCVYVSNNGQANQDGDARGDACDNCPSVSNSNQADLDGDSAGDACDACTDTDGDGFGNPGFPGICTVDNCPTTPNAAQANTDGDAFGDVCDVCPADPFNDADFDTICGDSDNCPAVTNQNQLNADGDALGDVCDVCPADPLDDADADTVCGDADNCPAVSNSSQANQDADSTGDACDPCTDTDNDGFGNPGFPGSCTADNCPAIPNAAQANGDGDTFGDACDVCPADPLDDADADTVCGDADNCPAVSNSNQANQDADSTGDACDPCTDTDNDGFGNPGFPGSCTADNCPAIPNAAQANGDGDTFGDACDICPADPLDDGDQDTVCGNLDNCPAVANSDQADQDVDGAGNACDGDDDDDGVADLDDCASLVRGVSEPPDPIASTLRLDDLGTTKLVWLLSYQGHVANVYSGEKLEGQPWSYNLSCLVPETPLPQGFEVRIPPPGALYYYLISSRNTCGESEAGRRSNGVPIHPAVACASLEADTDGDLILDVSDDCPKSANPNQSDLDGDYVGDVCDNCFELFNPDQANRDGDQLGDACD